MNRREILGLLSTGPLTSLAGCNYTKPTESSATESPSDADSDGVVNQRDYAPRDDAVQNKSDVLSQITSSITPVVSSKELGSVAMLLTDIGSHDVHPASDFQLSTNILPRVVDVSSTRTTLKLSDRVNVSGRQLLAVVQVFPRGSVIGWGTAKSSSDGSPTKISFNEPLPNTTRAYVSVFTIPEGRTPSDVSPSEVSYLCESDPVKISGNGVSKVSLTDSPSDVSADFYTRTDVEGGFLMSLSGRTGGHDWTVPYFVSKSAYYDRLNEPRGRLRKEYVTYALNSGVADEIAGLVRSSAKSIGDNGVSEVEFAVDFVQRLPYVRDSIGTGFDDYTKFPAETLVQLQGDCEDSTILLASILESLGRDVILAEFPGHIGVAVYGKYPDGSHFTVDGKKYYYVETTGEGWGIGTVPDKLSGVQATLKQI